MHKIPPQGEYIAHLSSILLKSVQYIMFTAFRKK